MSFPARLPGESNPNRKLTERWVRYIRRGYDRHVAGHAGGRSRSRSVGGVTLRELAEEVGVSHECVRQIGLRRTWKHLPEEP